MNEIKNISNEVYIIFNRQLGKARKINTLTSEARDLTTLEYNNLIKEKNIMTQEVKMAQVKQVKPAPEMVAKARAALDVQGNPKFLEIMQQVAKSQGIANQLVINEQKTYEDAANFLMALKKAGKDLNNMKKDALSFPKLYEKAVRNVMKPVESMLSESIKNVEKSMLRWVTQIEKLQKETEEKLKKEIPKVTVREEETIQSPPVQQTLPISPTVPNDVSTAIKSDKGLVTTREYTSVEVVDLLKLCKAVVSKAQNNSHVTLDLIQPNKKAIDQLALNSKRKIPGVDIVTKKSMVTRSK